MRYMLLEAQMCPNLEWEHSWKYNGLQLRMEALLEA